MANHQSNKAFSLFDAITAALGQAWARLAERQFEPLAKWSVMHLDQDGELQRSNAVDVLEAMPLERLILVRFGPELAPQVIKISRIVEAIDLPTGRKVILDRWLALQAGPNRHVVDVEHLFKQA